MNKTETDPQTWRADLELPRGREWHGLGVWGWQLQTTTVRMDKQRELYHLLGQTMKEDSMRKEYIYTHTHIYIYMTGSLYCTADTGTTL